MTQKTFKQAYEVLQKHAETLRNQQEPNIDDLLKIVTESVDAYNVCLERINAVEKAMEQAFSQAQLQEDDNDQVTENRADSFQTDSGQQTKEDDIPF